MKRLSIIIVTYHSEKARKTAATDRARLQTTAEIKDFGIFFFEKI